jgi:hypothetical protein
MIFGEKENLQQKENFVADRCKLIYYHMTFDVPVHPVTHIWKSWHLPKTRRHERHVSFHLPSRNEKSGKVTRGAVVLAGQCLSTVQTLMI